MKLDNNQIQELYKFTRTHYVEHYDLQTELVDHLANGIERQWTKTPKLSFEDAKQVEFKKFGVFGFMDVIEERRKIMAGRYRAIIWRFFKDWFKLPKLFITICIVSSLFTLLQMINSKEILEGVYFGIAFSLLTISTTYLFLTKKKRKLIMEKGDKKWMLGEMIYKMEGTNVIFNLFIQVTLVLVHRNDLQYLVWLNLLYSLLFTGLVIGTYITVFIIPKKAEELLEEIYPEYKVA